jgi:ParB-like chromosome segregation protein Spo0J
MTTMKAQLMMISELSEDPVNCRKHGERNIQAIMASLAKFGQQKPIIIDRTNVVRAGNGTLRAAKLLGWDRIEVCVSELVGSEMIAFAIADNRSAELATWDGQVLATTLEDLKFNSEELLESTGYTADELDAMLPSFEPGTEDDQGQLDQLEPKMVTCPNCGTEFDCREQV